MASDVLSRMMERIRYEDHTGLFFWKATGRKIGWVHTTGHIKIDFEKKKYYAHRMAYAFTNGEWPEEEIDHINGNKADNRIANLRACSRIENMRNSPQRAHSKQPYKGVRARANGRWEARISHLKKAIFLGTFNSAEEAYEAYLFAALDLHGEFMRGN